jgi:hypothetical protein
VSLDVGVSRVFGRQNGRQSIGVDDQCMAFVSYRGVSRSAEELSTFVPAMPPVVAGCRSSGGQDHGLMSHLTHHS